MRAFERGDIVALTFDPTLGREQQGHRPALVLTPQAFNRLGLIGVCPITQGGQGARACGYGGIAYGCWCALAAQLPGIRRVAILYLRRAIACRHCHCLPRQSHHARLSALARQLAKAGHLDGRARGTAKLPTP